MARRLFRSRTQRVIGGVCGGLGEYFNIDPNLIRVAFIVLAFFQGLGIIAYLAMWLIFPRQVPQEEPEASPQGEGTATAAEKEPLFRPRPLRGYWLGLVLIIWGLLLLFNKLTTLLVALGLLPVQLAWWPILVGPVLIGLWPLLLVVSGIIVLAMRGAK